MNLFTGGNPTLLGNTPAGGSLAQTQRRGHLATSAAVSLGLPAEAQAVAGQGDTARSAELALRTAEHGRMQTQQTLQADAAAAPRDPQGFLNDYKAKMVLGLGLPCDALRKLPVSLGMLPGQ